MNGNTSVIVTTVYWFICLFIVIGTINIGFLVFGVMIYTLTHNKYVQNATKIEQSDYSVYNVCRYGPSDKVYCVSTQNDRTLGLEPNEM